MCRSEGDARCSIAHSLSGDYKKADAIQRIIAPAANAVTAKHGISGLKYAMELEGFQPGVARRPLLPLKAAQQEDLATGLPKDEQRARRTFMMRIPFGNLPSMSTLFLDYVADWNRVRKFYPRDYSLESIVAFSRRNGPLSMQRIARSLCDALTEQQKLWGGSTASIERLSEAR